MSDPESDWPGNAEKLFVALYSGLSQAVGSGPGVPGPTAIPTMASVEHVLRQVKREAESNRKWMERAIKAECSLEEVGSSAEEIKERVQEILTACDATAARASRASS